MRTFNLSIGQGFDATLATYMNLDVPRPYVEPYLELLKRALGEPNYTLYTSAQQRRDLDRHHITVISSIEYPALKREDLAPLLDYPVIVRCLGIGRLQEGANETYFLVCESDECQQVRNHFGLCSATLHITLGFKTSDIYDRPKDTRTLIPPFSFIERF